jgi:hybrid cluster-associated redox disulfide protein
MAHAITRAMRVQDILALLPHAQPLLAEYGLHCVGCAGSEFETLEEGYCTHGFAEDKLDDLVIDLNSLFERQPERPKTIAVTEAAALGLMKILEDEGQADHYLVVGLDDAGGFCLDVLPDVADDHALFGHEKVPALKLAASPVTLRRLGGATIDHRDGRFKLDLPGDGVKKTCACANGGECACAKDGKEPGSCGCQ